VATHAVPSDPRVVPAGAYWRGRQEIRADLRSSLGIVLALALAGVPAGLLWWWLAPRADFRITESGPVVIGNPSEELLVGDDVVFTLVLAGLGLLAGAAAWWLRRRRGVATLLALALGTAVAAVVAWQVGALLGAGPTKAQLADVGARGTTALHLGSLPALAVGPFVAVFAYLVPALVLRTDDLGRVPAGGFPASAQPTLGEPEPGGPVQDDRDLVDAPPPGRPQA
jgi:LPXTG-motif cell wall-anchored protein